MKKQNLFDFSLRIVSQNNQQVNSILNLIATDP